MTILSVPPYYENFDDSHCTQCALRGVLEHFEQGKSWTWDEMDRFTDKELDKWTWQYRGQINMAERGYDVVAINSENVDVMLKEGVYEYFVRELGKEAADEIREFSNLNAANDDMIRFQQLVKDGVIHHELRTPTMDDVRSYIQQGYLIDCALNSYRLRNEDGYSSHMVLIYGVDDQNITFHDSSINHGKAGMVVPIEQFVAACTSPTPSQWAITAYKLKK